ncbi:MAG: hypothetical protein WBM07_00255 [Chitinivibrionales bacterium]
MDISQIGSGSLQSAQLQSYLASLESSSNAASGSDPFLDLLQSSQSAAANNSTAADSNSASGLAMLQALEGMYGTNANNSLLQLLGGTDDTSSTDPLLEMLSGTDGTNTVNPLLDSPDGTDDTTDGMFDSNLAMFEALQGANGGSATAQSNALAMLQALNSNDSTLLQTELGNSAINASSTNLTALADNEALQAFLGTNNTGASNSALLQALQNGANNTVTTS